MNKIFTEKLHIIVFIACHSIICQSVSQILRECLDKSIPIASILW